MALIEIDALSFGYAGRRVLEDVRLSINAGERIAILGGSGNGKTTLAQWLAGWLPTAALAATSGGVTCCGRAWGEWPLAERAAFVQFIGQVPAQQFSGRAFTVREEISFGPENLALAEGEVRQRTEEAIEACGLERLAERDPFTLSGGEQQRLILAAALAMKPRVLVLDEPMTNLDPAGCQEILQLLKELPRDVTLILLDASPRVAVELMSRFILLESGKIRLDGSAEEVLLAPATISALGLPPAAEAGILARECGAWSATVPIPLTVETAISAFQQVENARR